MPELPEVERARAVLAAAAQGRRIDAVDDTDTFVCRPHRPGEIAQALHGRRLTAAHRRGKTLWCETSGVGRSRTPGPTLGLHLGMGGVLLVSPPGGGDAVRGGDPWPTNTDGRTTWNRFTVDFADRGELVLFDKRRLARVRLEPDIDALGPDAQHVTDERFAAILAASRAPVKARIMDQSVLAGVGNLLADEALWQSELRPARPAGELTRAEADRLHQALSAAISRAIQRGGVHTGEVIEARHRDGHCPRCGAEMVHGTVGGRSTWWCSAEQAG